MPAPLLMLLATLLFAVMGLCVKLASSTFSAGEIVMVRGAVGVVLLWGLSRWRRVPLATPVPGMHFWRGLVGVMALCLWFWAIGGLPLATAMTFNYMSAIWMAVFLMGGAVLVGSKSVDPRLIATVLTGFAGVALVLQPTFHANQLPWALAGLSSGVLSAMAYMQVTALGRAGEPELRVVFYFSLASLVAGALVAAFTHSSGNLANPGWRGAGLLLAVGVTASLAQVCMTAAYARGKMLVNASLNYSGIAFSALFGWLAFGERPGWLAAAGIALIVAAGLMATLLRTRQHKDLPGDTHE
jgi:drug/metabolite transporter (DMT)-like permease